MNYLVDRRVSEAYAVTLYAKPMRGSTYIYVYVYTPKSNQIQPKNCICVYAKPYYTDIAHICAQHRGSRAANLNKCPRGFAFAPIVRSERPKSNMYTSMLFRQSELNWPSTRIRSRSLRADRTLYTNQRHTERHRNILHVCETIRSHNDYTRPISQTRFQCAYMNGGSLF